MKRNDIKIEIHPDDLSEFIIPKSDTVFKDSKGRRWTAQALKQVIEAHYDAEKARVVFSQQFHGWSE